EELILRTARSSISAFRPIWKIVDDPGSNPGRSTKSRCSVYKSEVVSKSNGTEKKEKPSERVGLSSAIHRIRYQDHELS
ncbi:MAG: hypothetical protein QXX17_05745, partial [Conexivisphaerales archaeon]